MGHHANKVLHVSLGAVAAGETWSDAAPYKIDQEALRRTKRGRGAGLARSGAPDAQRSDGEAAAGPANRARPSSVSRACRREACRERRGANVVEWARRTAWARAAPGRALSQAAVSGQGTRCRALAHLQRRGGGQCARLRARERPGEELRSGPGDVRKARRGGGAEGGLRFHTVWGQDEDDGGLVGSVRGLTRKKGERARRTRLFAL